MNAVPAPRRSCIEISVGSARVGGQAPIGVQTMTTTDTRDTEATLAQIGVVAAAGCDIVRVAVPDRRAAEALGVICAQSAIPVVADIHFDYRLAVEAAERGAAAIRINPGNLGGVERLRPVADAARANGASLRVGVNSGSLESDIEERYGRADPRALAESALRHARALEALGFEAIEISVKSSDVVRTVQAYRLVAAACRYPLHVGVTEAGTLQTGTVRSSVGIGILLSEGIGDTIRVSLTAEPEREIEVGLDILRSLGLRAPGPSVTSCPTCGRCQVDAIGMANRVERALRELYAGRRAVAFPRVAVMGCMVNGPGEARDADLALAGGPGVFGLYRKGQRVGLVPEADAEAALLTEVTAWLNGAAGA